MEWVDYTYHVGNTYCYEIPRENWIGEVGREMHWWINATDFSGKSKTNAEPILGGMITDDDEDYPQFSNLDYDKRPMYNEPTLVSIRLSDESGIFSANLTYDYDYSTGVDGFNNTPYIYRGIYTFTIPAPCPGMTNPTECEYKWKNMRFWINATDYDDDRPGDKLSKTIISPSGSDSILIDPPGEEPEINQTHEPYIYVYGPSEFYITIKECGHYPFVVDAEDPDKDLLTYSWSVDGEQASDGKEFTYEAQSGDIGEHEIEIIVSDGELADSHKWIVNVIAGQCDAEENQTQDTNTTDAEDNSDVGGDDGGSSNDGVSSSGDSPSGGSSGGFSGGSSYTSTTTTSTTLKQTNAVPTTVKTKEVEQSNDQAQDEDAKSEITGLVTLVDTRYLVISIIISSLVLFVLLKFLKLKYF